MKRFIAVPLAVAAVAIPATAGATQMGSAAKAGPQQFKVGFTVVSQNNKPVAVKKFQFDNLPIDCDEGPILLDGDISGQFPVNGKHKFGGTANDPAGGKIRVTGRFKNHNKKVVGRVKATGDFDGGAITNCSGAENYVAK